MSTEKMFEPRELHGMNLKMVEFKHDSCASPSWILKRISKWFKENYDSGIIYGVNTDVFLEDETYHLTTVYYD